MPKLIQGSNQHKKRVKCPPCNGSGKINQKSCSNCNGRTFKESTINKKIVAKKKAIKEVNEELIKITDNFNNKLKIINKMKSFG
jgi:DnaJ-class molecular chaperone